jgi:dihydrofolate reductase
VGKLIYSAITSLDGFVADENGKFDWAVPDAEVHAFVNELERPIGTYLYGRRMYEVMAAWETMEVADEPALIQDYSKIWKAAEKIVYSTTLDEVTTSRTRLEQIFDPAAIRELKMHSARDLSMGGPMLAGHAFAAGLIDECHLFLTPVVVGGGTRSLPGHHRAKVELLDERRFESGVVHLHYAT